MGDGFTFFFFLVLLPVAAIIVNVINRSLEKEKSISSLCQEKR